MSKNKFDKEKIDVAKSDDLPVSFVVLDNEKVYDIREKNSVWWQCPKCGGDIEFDAVEFNDELIDGFGKNQLFAVCTWNCEDCGAEGSLHTAVTPRYISIAQEDDED